MTGVDRWDGAQATVLQKALRLTIEELAHRLEVSPRTVAGWHSDGSRVPRPHAQRLLDRLLAGAHPYERARFDDLRKDPTVPASTGLHAALAIVVRSQDVLLVRRREPKALAWQFPAGVVKPESAAEDVAISETIAETGIDCTVRTRIGSRVHPRTGVYCVYLLCDYLAGEPENRDPLENVSVRWVPISDLSNFIPESAIYPPVLEALAGGYS
jgi:8-oxo-dGTP pyrophosphatase MutT (NUDIX family)